MSLLFRGADAPSELFLELLGKRENGSDLPTLSMRQVLFDFRASLQARGPLSGMRFERGARGSI